jgi:hypothetical protein
LQNANRKADEEAVIGDTLFKAAQAAELQEARYAECRGMAFDGTDPLWEELCSTLLKPEEDIGDGDLTSAARERLTADGVYRLLDADSSDEWLCLPSIPLQQSLEAAQTSFASTRRNWLTDDLIDARVLWETLSDMLTRRRLRFQEPPPSASTNGWKGKPKPNPSEPREEAEDRLEKAAELLDKEMQRVVALGPKLEAQPATLDSATMVLYQQAAAKSLKELVGTDFVEAVKAARSVVEELQQASLEIKSQRDRRPASSYNGWYSKSDAETKPRELDKAKQEVEKVKAEAFSNPLDDELRADAYDPTELHSFRAMQLLLCLERCLHVCYSFCSGTASGDCPDVALLVVGAQAQIKSLTASAEQNLNGQAGRLEAFHADLGLWRVELEESGTRLLLAPKQLSCTEAADANAAKVRNGRSRSPRRTGSNGGDTKSGVKRLAVTLLDLVREAAAKGEYVMVHHDVAWSQ